MKLCPVCGSEYPDTDMFCPKDGGTLQARGGTRDLVGQVVADRYRILKKLGEGGMGQVYLAEHVMMGRKSAIKVMSSGMSSDPEAVSRFNREASNAARINHPNVCAVYDFGPTTEGRLYLAMEYIAGRTLSDLLRETGPLPLPRAAELLMQCAEALRVAHDLEIVHRDLKPDNIMVVQTKTRELVKVVDFGIAKAVGGEAGQQVTRTGLVVGTPEYMSPEQLSGDPLDGRSDIYSLALVFYRMITGTLPFPADSAQETMVKRLTEDPRPLQDALPSGRFPPELQPVLDRALARWPKDRYTAAVAFARDVNYALGSAPDLVLDQAAEAATQMVDAMATQQLGPTVPRTRVAGRSGESAPAGAKGATGPAPARRPRGLMVGVAAAVVLVAGGGYLLRDRLAPAPSIVPGPIGADSLASLTVVPPGSESAGTTAPATLPLSRPVNSGRDGAGGTGRDTTSDPAVRPGPPATAAAPPTLPEVDAIEDAATRVAARQQAEQIYGRTDLSRGLRAAAAATVAHAYQLDEDWSGAVRWLERAVALEPTEGRRTLLDQLKRLTPN